MGRSTSKIRKRNKSAKGAKLAWVKRRNNQNNNNPLSKSDACVSSTSTFSDNTKLVQGSPERDASEVLLEVDSACSSHEDDWDAEVLKTRYSNWNNKTYGKKKMLKNSSGIISSDEYDRINNSEMNYEEGRKPKHDSQIITGNRIVELGYVLNWATSLQYNHAKICTLGILSVKSENRRGKGFVSTIVFECSSCSRTYAFETEDPKKPASVINTGAVWGTLASGGTYEHMNELFGSMDIPAMPVKMFSKIENNLEKEWEESLLRSMVDAGVREKEKALELGQLCEDGTPWVTVYVDGSWSKRSYGVNFNALSGMVGIIGKNTGELLFIAVRNRFCLICTKSPENTPEHNCYKNWSGSAPAMEADMVVEGFRESENMHGVRYLQFIADGDSSVFAKIQQCVPYGKEVRKIECTNHALKNYGKRLRNIKADTKISLEGRKLLTLAKIKRLTQRAKCSIYEHAKLDTNNVDLLRSDLRTGLHHVYGDHTRCRPGICNTPGESSDDNLVSKLESTMIYNHLNGALDLLVRKAHLLIANENNNRAERLMNIVARFNGGKRFNLIQRGSYQRRVFLSGLRYNKKFEWHLSPLKRVLGSSPGEHLKSFVQKNTQRQTYKCRKRLFTNQSDAKQVPPKGLKPTKNTDYGPNAEQPEDEEMMKKDVEEIIYSLQVTEAKRDQIQKLSVGQFGNTIFENERERRCTASLFGKVIKRRPYTSCHNLVKACVSRSYFHSAATEFGICREKVAIALFEKKTGLEVEPSGLWVDLTRGYLGASPDGLVGNDALVEVKCIYSASKLDLKTNTIEEIVAIMKSKICLKKNKNGKIELDRTHSYYYQIQGQLNIANRSKCYFVVYVNDTVELYIEEIFRDACIWETVMVPKLEQFYRECIAPALVRDNIRRGVRCEDPPFIKEAIATYELKKTTNKIESLNKKKKRIQAKI